MTFERHIVNPHPVPNRTRLSQVDDRILRDLILMHRAELAPGARLQLAGIPPLALLESELRRREASRAVAS
jgi:hypothetical protein